MKVELNSELIKKEITEYPCIGDGGRNGLVVLFHKVKCGIVLREGGTSHKVGDYREDWGMNYFTQFEGTITLSNE